MFGRSFLLLARQTVRHKLAVTAVLVAIPLIQQIKYTPVHCDTQKEVAINTERNVIIPVNELETTTLQEETSETETIPKKEEEKEEEVPQLLIEDDEDEVADAAWMEEKQKCSFCKMFIFSPCKKQFKLWSLCVDKAKAEEKDFTTACSFYTKALMNCTSDNSDYFQALEQASEAGAAEEEAVGNDDK